MPRSKTPANFTAESVQSRLSAHYVHHGQATIVATYLQGYDTMQYISPTGQKTHSKIIAKRWAEQLNALMRRGVK